MRHHTSERLKELIEAKVTQSGASTVPVALTTSDSITWEGNYTPVVGYNGTASFFIKAKDLIGFTGTGLSQFDVDIPTDFAVEDVFTQPETFNPILGEHTTIHYTVRNHTADTVSVGIYRIRRTDGAQFLFKEYSFNNVQKNVPQEVVWNGTVYIDSYPLPVLPGLYVCRINAARNLTGEIETATEKSGEIRVIWAGIDSESTSLENPGNANLFIEPYGPDESPDTAIIFAMNVQGLAPVNAIYDLQPDGAFYDPPAILIIYYDPQEVAGFEDKLKIFKFDTEINEWVEVPDQILDMVNHCLKVPISHLSYYSLMFAKSEVNISPPIAQITYPAQMSLAGRNIEVKGTAKGMLFGSYRFEYGAGAFPDTWTLIEPVYGYPVESSTLTIWNTTGLEGIYTLRLTVANRIGDTASTQVTIIIDNTNPTTTTLTIGEPKYNYGNGTPVVVTSHTPFVFSSLDTGAVQSGIAWVECSVDNDTSWIIVTQTGEDTITGARIFTFSIPDTYPDCQHTVYYRGVDNVGNCEDSRSVTITLDNSKPVALLLYPSKEDKGICKVINSNTMSIIGTTTDIHFSRYSLQLKAMKDGETPTGWIVINEAELQKETQSLGVWTTAQFTKSRWYYIRIVSSDKVNNTSIDTVSIFLGDPEVKLVFGSHGNDNGEFKEPYGIAFSPTQTGSDNSGCIFVTDNKNDRVQKFDMNGNFLLSFNGRSEESHKLKKPSGIAVTTVVSGEWSADTRPMVFVADRDNDRIQAFDLSGNYLFSFGERHDIKRPEQLSVGLYYTYSDTSYACTKAVYVADAKKDRIAIFDYEGNLLATISNLDDPEGVFALNHLQYPGPSQASVYIANTDDNIVTVYTSALTPTFSIRGLDDPRAVYADRKGYIYVSDTNHNKIKRYNRYGELLMQYSGSCTTSLDKPVGICLDNNGNLWIADEENDRIVKIGAPTVDETMAMRMFSLPKAAPSIKDAYAFPVPFKPNSGLGHTAISFKLYSTSNILLRIYNIAGELVFEQAGITVDPYIWSVINNWNEPVASGVYIYFLTDDTKERKIGKIMIIR